MSNGLAIVTKDSDFNILSVYNGFPPKVIWLKTGNCTTAQIESLFRSKFSDIQAFETDASLGTLVITNS
jgi:predicted nuclease of predicted toxin-antitoxin system